jgi:multidrug efflux system membrane fusion protein
MSTPPRPRLPRISRLALVLSALLALAALAAGCKGEEPAKGGGAKPVTVGVALALARDTPVELRAVGTVQPLASVAVIPRAGGMIVEQHVGDGQRVAEGQPLFRIDPRPARADLREARARLDRDLAALDQARRDMLRQQDLVTQAAVSQEQFERARTEVASLAATVEMDRAAVERIELELEYTDVRAPIAGQAGKVLVQRGTVVEADKGTLLVVNQLSPIAVDFAVPEQHLPVVRQRLLQGGAEVLALPTGDTGAPEAGILVAMDNTVDKATGTIGLRAVFDNPSGRLWPGQFARTTLVLGVLPRAVVVPSAAVNVGIDGPYCYVVQDGRVVLRAVDLGPVLDGETVLASGVAPGETVVTRGQIRLKPGSAVRVSPGAPGDTTAPADPQAPAAAPAS